MEKEIELSRVYMVKVKQDLGNMDFTVSYYQPIKIFENVRDAREYIDLFKEGDAIIEEWYVVGKEEGE